MEETTMSNPNATPYAELRDVGADIVIRSVGTLERRLRSSGCDDAQVVADLAVAALAMRLSPRKAIQLAASKGATAAARSFTPPKSVRCEARA
jgi:hypothetical protein